MAEEKRSARVHKINMENRESAYITGVIDVLSFDEELIVAETDIGLLEIKGADLHVVKLNLDDGELIIEGELDSFLYEEPGRFAKGKGSIFGKIFK